jgi:hypothetical protein
MDNAQVIAATVAGLIAPFVQEIVFGAKITGRAAAVLAALVSLVLATLAFWATGGFAAAVGAPAFSLVDPSAFFGFWIKVFTPVYAISQLVYGITTKHGEESPPATGPIQTVAEKVQPVIGTG